MIVGGGRVLPLNVDVMWCGLNSNAFREYHASFPPIKRSTIMAQASIPRDMLKQAMKEALAEALVEQRDLFRDVFAEVLEDFALVEAIEEGRETERVERSQIFDLFEGQA